MRKLNLEARAYMVKAWTKIKSSQEVRKELTRDVFFVLGVIMLFAGCSLVHCSLGLITVGSLLVFLVVRGAGN